MPEPIHNTLPNKEKIMEMSRRQVLLATGSTMLLQTPVLARAAEAPQSRQWSRSFDVVIAGGGAAGVMAAINAAKAGASVLLVQATVVLGGNSAISSGWIRSVNTKWHAKKGIQDTAKAYEENIIEYGCGTRNPKKAAVIAERSHEFVDFLIDWGVPFTDDEDRFNGGNTLRVVKAKGGGGAVMKGLLRALRETKNVTVMTSTRLTDIIPNASRTAIEGVEILSNGKKELIGAKALVLATGGFGRNQDYVERFANQWAKTGRIMDVGDLGDGLRMATELGAGAQNLEICMVCPTLEVTRNVFFSSAPVVNGAIFVNEKGRRFTNEYVIYTKTNIDMLKQQKVWEIATPEQHATVNTMIRMGVAVRCDTIEDLARHIGCDPAGLKADIEEHNRITAMPADQRNDRFGRKAYGKPLNAPYYAVRVKPVMIETVGGIMIDEQTRVTSLFGKPILNGFFAAGAVAFGEHFAKGYRSGEAYVYAGVTGLVAGEQAARYAKSL